MVTFAVPSFSELTQTYKKIFIYFYHVTYRETTTVQLIKIVIYCCLYDSVITYLIAFSFFLSPNFPRKVGFLLPRWWRIQIPYQHQEMTHSQSKDQLKQLSLNVDEFLFSFLLCAFLYCQITFRYTLQVYLWL